MVLAVTIVNHADRSNTEPHKVAGGTRQVALEVATQRSLPLRDGQIVVRAREMIHADVHVTRDGQLFDRELKDGEF